MAQYFRHFQSDTTDAAPFGMTARWVTTAMTPTVRASGIPSGATYSKALQVVGTGAGARWALSLDAVGAPSGDVDVVAKILHEHTFEVNRSTMGVHVQGSGAATTESSYAAFANTTPNLVYISKYASGVLTESGNGGNVLIDRSIWYRLRLQRTGTTVRAKIWADGSSEPAGWAFSTTDTTHTSGWVGIGFFLSSTQGSTWIDWIGVGTGGDAAPDAPVAGVVHALAGVATLAIEASAAMSPLRALSGTATLELLASGTVIVPYRLLAGVAELSIIAPNPTLFTGAVQLLEGSAELTLTATAPLGVLRALAGEATLELTAATPELGVLIIQALAGEATLSLAADPAVMTYGWRALAGTATLALDGTGTLLGVRGLAARIVLGLGLAEVYVGPGSGLSTGLTDPNAVRARLIAALGAGDSLPVHLTQAGLAGLSGRARALTRVSRDDLDEPLIEAQFSSRDEARPSAPASGQTPRYQPPTRDNQSRQVKRLTRRERG